MKKLLILLAYFPFALIGQSYVPNALNGEVVRHSYYSLSYNENHEQAEWVYYELSLPMITGFTERTNDFRSDPKVSSGSSALADYKYSGYDRGHLAPAGDMKISNVAMSESFYLSNISPQIPSFNRGTWKSLESLVRIWVREEGDLYIVTGPVFKNTHRSIGVNHVTIPSHFYKVIYSEEKGKMIGFLLPHQKISDPLTNYTTSVDRIEELTGLDFYSQLEDSIEDELESKVNAGTWNFSRTSKTQERQTQSLNPVSHASQCLGIAKSTGNRCKNRTKNKNNYCNVHQSQAPGYVKPKPSNYVGRCNATTQAGSRCKRNASSGSRYCWQHK